MLRKAALGLAMIAALSGVAHAQENKAALTAATNLAITPNGVGAITANVLNTLLNTIIPSTGTLLDNNVWSLTQTFSVAPIFSTLTGYMYAHAGGVPTVSTTIPWANISSTPTTIAGYGITVLPWANVTGTPTTIAGYGITVLPWANVTGTPTTIGGYGISVLPWANVTGTPTTFSGYGIASGPASAITFTQNGVAALATSVDTIMKQRMLYATDFMTAAQIANGSARTDTIDVSQAVQACVTQALAAIKNCYIPSGKWYMYNSSSPQPLVINNAAVLSNGPVLVGDGAASELDFTANTTNGHVLYEATGGTGTGALAASSSYGGLVGVHLDCHFAGPCVQNGQFNFFDQMNQQTFFDVSVQNFDTSNASTCFQFNAMFSPVAGSVNCSSAAGPTGGNDLYQFRAVSFGFFNIGGSNGQTFLHMTSGTNTGNVFSTVDCEVVQTCVTIDSSTTQDNKWDAGTYSYNWGSSGANAVAASAGSDNIFEAPNQNANTTTGGAGSFLSSGSATHAQLWNSSTVAMLASPTFTGTVTIPNLVLTGLTTGTPVYYLCLDAGEHVILSSSAC